ncbi:MAG: transcriptional regulator [Gammaproteobacteria bacterium RIFCSPHIGHO2_12_FULL_37_34]|nr:MAG: transcriptional regulator [Gammaproteobacteria bacterium RIFCSPHIGHO2_12_FULL_37_34]
MKTAKKEKHPSILETVHETAKGLYDANIIDAITMREFDELCLPKIKKLSPRQIKSIRLREKVSQPVFAKFLNTTLSTVRQWEQGEKHPRGTSLRLLNLVGEKGLGVLLSGSSHHNEGAAA